MGERRKQQREKKARDERVRRDVDNLVATVQSAADSPIDAAKRLFAQSKDATTKNRAVQLVQKALELWPDYPAACKFMADSAESTDEVLKWLHLAVDGGEQFLSEARAAGALDGVDREAVTEPYIYCALRLARHDRVFGLHERALGLYRKVLEVDPRDPMAARFFYAAHLFYLGRIEDARQLILAWPDEEYFYWAYNRALLAFHDKGDCEESRLLLEEAIARNSFVPRAMANSAHRDDSDLEESYFAENREAHNYARTYVSAWRAVPGAIHWISNASRRLDDVMVDEDEPWQDDDDDWEMEDELDEDSDEFSDESETGWDGWRASMDALPMSAGEIWQAGVYVLATDENREDPPCYVLVAQPDGEQMHATEQYDSLAEAEADLLDLLIVCMEEPADDRPRRPSEVHIRAPFPVDDIVDILADADVDCVAFETLEPLDSMAKKAERIVLSSAVDAPDSVDVSNLPIDPTEVWQVGSFRPSQWMTFDDGEVDRPVLVMAVLAGDGCVLDYALGSPKQQTDFDWIWRHLAAAMNSEFRQPCKPSRMQFDDPALAEGLRPYLSAAGIDLDITDDLGDWNEAKSGYIENVVGGDRETSLVTLEGASEQLLRAYYAASADLYRLSPWRTIAAEQFVRVDCPAAFDNPRCAAIFGQCATSAVVTLIDDLDRFRATFRANQPMSPPLARCVSVYFGENFDLSPRDVEAIELRNYPVATPEAYPRIYSVRNGERSPFVSLDELRQAVICLQSIAGWLTAGADGPCEVNVECDGRMYAAKASKTEL